MLLFLAGAALLSYAAGGLQQTRREMLREKQEIESQKPLLAEKLLAAESSSPVLLPTKGEALPTNSETHYHVTILENENGDIVHVPQPVWERMKKKSELVEEDEEPESEERDEEENEEEE
jgi:hypothetical protein